MPTAMPLSLVLFTRLPQPGHAKTRLIPALGAGGAAELQRQMTRLSVARAWAFCAAAPGRRLVIAYDGGSERERRGLRRDGFRCVHAKEVRSWSSLEEKKTRRMIQRNKDGRARKKPLVFTRNGFASMAFA
jgi:hypothetical protein